MPRLFDSLFVQYALGLFLRLLFIGGHIVALPWLLVIERFALPADRQRIWRIAAHGLNHFIFKTMGLRVHALGRIPSPTERARLYVANHPTIIDGFLFFSILGPELIPLTAPAQLQIFPFNIWFPKMGMVDVARDAYDAIHCSTVNGRHEAVRKLVAYATREQKSLLIFPEGHVEWGGEVHYIHTGAARVALRAKTPVVPLALINMDRVFPGGLRFRPGPVYVRTARELPPLTLSRVLPYRHAAKIFTKEIAAALYSLLPSRVIPRDLNDKHPAKIGVFVDIDRTLYKGYSQQAFLKYLQAKKVVSNFASVRLLGYLLLEKVGWLAHDKLMRRAYRFTRGWREASLARQAEWFFQENVIPRLVHNMIPILKDHAERGHQIFLISEVIRPLARQFQHFIGASAIATTQLKKHRGRYTGEVFKLCVGEDKARNVERLAKQHGVDLDKSYAYGDSPADLPMLRLVRHPVAVRPKGNLKHEAMLNGWIIIH